MGFSLGNFNVDEIILGVAESFEGDLLYTLDQLSSAKIEIKSDSTDIKDKKGNIVRTIYHTKTGEFTAKNAFLHPQVMNAQSGSKISVASSSAPVVMPKIAMYAAGATPVLPSDYVADTLRVIGVYGNGGNTKALTQSTVASATDLTFGLSGNNVTLPAAAKDAPASYVLKYDRKASAGYKLVNDASVFASTSRMTLYCSIVDPCSDSLRSAYVYLPSFQPSPETSISLDADEQELEFNGKLQTDFCAAQKNLYVIYFPDEDAVTTAIAA